MNLLNNTDKTAFKREIKEQCALIVIERINTIKQAMQSAQDSVNSEDKSSAGDKYEVGRAMGHLQQEMLVEQLHKAEDEMAVINSLNCETICSAVTNGTVVICKGFVFFIALGLGNILIGEQKVVALSPVAPLAISLLNKRKGDAFVFNKNNMDITDVF